MEQAITLTTDHASAPALELDTWNKLGHVVSEFASDLACPICLELLSEPTQLPCGHFFCWDCIHKTLKRVHSKVVCPICKKITNKRDLACSQLLSQLLTRYTALEALHTTGLASQGLPAPEPQPHHAAQQPATDPVTRVAAPCPSPPSGPADTPSAATTESLGQDIQQSGRGGGPQPPAALRKRRSGPSPPQAAEQPPLKQRPRGAPAGTGVNASPIKTATLPTANPVGDVEPAATTTRNTTAGGDVLAAVTVTDVGAAAKPLAPLTVASLFDPAPDPAPAPHTTATAFPSSDGRRQNNRPTPPGTGLRLSALFDPAPDQPASPLLPAQQATVPPARVQQQASPQVGLTDVHAGAGRGKTSRAQAAKARGTKRQSASPALDDDVNRDPKAHHAALDADVALTAGADPPAAVASVAVAGRAGPQVKKKRTNVTTGVRRVTAPSTRATTPAEQRGNTSATTAAVDGIPQHQPPQHQQNPDLSPTAHSPTRKVAGRKPIASMCPTAGTTPRATLRAPALPVHDAVPATHLTKPAAQPAELNILQPGGHGAHAGDVHGGGAWLPGAGTPGVVDGADGDVVAASRLVSPTYFGTLKVAAATPGGLGVPGTSARRVPVRLMPWACPYCTLHNSAVAKKCSACTKPRPHTAMLVAPEVHMAPITTLSTSRAIPAAQVGPSRGRIAPRVLPLHAAVQPGHETHPAALREPEALVVNVGHVTTDTASAAAGAGPAALPAASKPGAGKAPAKKAGNTRRASAGDAEGHMSAFNQEAIVHAQTGGVGRSADVAVVARTPAGSPLQGVEPGRPAATPAAATTAATTGRGKGNKRTDREGSVPRTITASKPPLPTAQARSVPATPTTMNASGAPVPTALAAVAAATVAAAGVGSKGAGRRLGSWSGASQWVLLGSGLAAADVALLKKLASLSGCELVDEWRLDVTHVVCGEDVDGRARRTIKYLMAIAHGCWVVRMSWVKSCLNASAPVSPDEHEIQTDTTGGAHGPSKGRASKVSSAPKLMTGYSIHLAGPFSSKDEITALAKASGATVLLRPAVKHGDAQAVSRDQGEATVATTPAQQSDFVLVDVESCKGARKALQVSASAVEAGMVLLSYKWLLDCIGSQRIVPTAPHIVK